MRMGYDLVLEQQQKLVMTPELKLALKILQLPVVDLGQLIEHELEVNPVLDIAEESKIDKKEIQQDLVQKEKEIDWKEYLQYQGKSYCLEAFDGEESQQSYLDNMVTYSHTLRDHLLSQLYLLPVEKEIKNIGEFIIESLDENGYLTTPLEDIINILGSPEEKAQKALSLIQSFEPYGVGARDLKECLLIQLKNKGLLTKSLKLIVMEHLDDIASNKLQIIAKKLQISIEEAQRQSDMIKDLEPKPGRSFEGSAVTRYIIPDAYIDKIDGEYVITVNDHYGPRLVINSYYKNILKSESKTSKASLYINDKLSSAMWLIKSIESRRSTLYNVMQAIAAYQNGFFEKGPMYLRIMTLKNIAEIVSVHESTVSRAISGKYVQTPRGLFEIKYFFKSGVDSLEGDGISSESIKRMIKDYIQSEDNSKPVSDQNIADLLVKGGFMISRRTVAKYRDELGIPASSKRKRYKPL